MSRKIMENIKFKIIIDKEKVTIIFVYYNYESNNNILIIRILYDKKQSKSVINTQKLIFIKKIRKKYCYEKYQIVENLPLIKITSYFLEKYNTL